MEIPETHEPGECPGCQTGHPCRVVTRGTVRYWWFYRNWPETWGDIITRDTLADAGAAPPGPPRGVDGAAVAACPRPAAQKASPETIAARLACCRTPLPCYLPGEIEKCRPLVANGRGGVLMHPRGIPNARARCPLGQWDSEV